MKENRMEYIVNELRNLASHSKIMRGHIAILSKDGITKRAEMMLDEIETKMIDIEMAIKRFTQ